MRPPGSLAPVPPSLRKPHCVTLFQTVLWSSDILLDDTKDGELNLQICPRSVQFLSVSVNCRIWPTLRLITSFCWWALFAAGDVPGSWALWRQRQQHYWAKYEEQGRFRVALPASRRSMNLEKCFQTLSFLFLFPSCCQRSVAYHFILGKPKVQCSPRVSQGGLGAVDRLSWCLRSHMLCQLGGIPFSCWLKYSYVVHCRFLETLSHGILQNPALSIFMLMGEFSV